MLAKTKIAGLAMALMVLSVPMVYADNGMGDGDSSHQAGDWLHGQQDHMMAQVLNLSDDQVKQLKDSQQKQKEAMKSLFEQMKANREAFNAEIIKATPDMNKINDVQTQIKTLQAQMVDNHLNSLLEIRKILAPEQFAGYMALKKERELIKKHMMEHDKFGHKGGFDKDGDGHEHWDDQGDRDHSSDGQD
jgi:Spy/CpxP family protein refolding chaperone